MRSLKRLPRVAYNFLKAYGPTSFKKYSWDKEYLAEKWHFADNTAGDCVYPYLEKYLRNGRILDLGCGSGNTSTELTYSVYQSYVGVDVSDAALNKARKRSRACGRDNKNQFVCSDFFSYQPTGEFDVILFRESLYHIPPAKIRSILDRYAAFLKDEGVFIVRLFSADMKTSVEKSRPMGMIRLIESQFDTIESCRYPEPGYPTVLVFRPYGRTSPAAEQKENAVSVFRS